MQRVRRHGSLLGQSTSTPCRDRTPIRAHSGAQGQWGAARGRGERTRCLCEARVIPHTGAGRSDHVPCCARCRFALAIGLVLLVLRRPIAVVALDTCTVLGVLVGLGRIRPAPLGRAIGRGAPASLRGQLHRAVVRDDVTRRGDGAAAGVHRLRGAARSGAGRGVAGGSCGARDVTACTTRYRGVRPSRQRCMPT